MPDRGTAVLLISCPDKPGIVASVSEFLYRNGANLVSLDEHLDSDEHVFLQRIEWDIAGFAIPREEIEDAFRPMAMRFGMTWSLHFSDDRPRIAIMASQLPHCLYDLLTRWRVGEYKADVQLVISNHELLRRVAEDFAVPYEVHGINNRQTKAHQEAKVLKRLDDENIDIVVLARYNQTLSDEMVYRFPNRIINIHHSFLPAFAGSQPYHQAHERGVKIIGATAHYATRQLDDGPIIEQDVVRISHRDTVDDLVRKGADLERIVLARAVDLHLKHRVLVYGNRTVVFQ